MSKSILQLAFHVFYVFYPLQVPHLLGCCPQCNCKIDMGIVVE
jgi:hypothetical protein